LLSSSSSLTPTFVPDVEGYYLVTATVDGATNYSLRIGVLNVANTSTITAIRFLPVNNSQIPAPPSGATVFFSIELNDMARKLSDGSVARIETT
jgi:hypothetical protein